MDSYSGTKPSFGETVIPVKKKKSRGNQRKSQQRKKKTRIKIGQPKPICNIIESIYSTIDPTQNCTSTDGSKYLD